MILVIKSIVLNALAKDLEKLGILELEDNGHVSDKPKRGSRHKFTGYYDNKEGHLDLSALTRRECENLEQLLRTCNVLGSKILATDVKRYLKASDNGAATVTARTVRQAAFLLEHYVAGLEHHLVFSNDDYGGSSHSGYYVGDVEYVPEHKRYGDTTVPEHVNMELWYVDKEVRHVWSLDLYRGDVYNMTHIEILDAAGLVPENNRLLGVLRQETELFYATTAKIGTQYYATGLGICDLDSATKEEHSYYRGHDKIKLAQAGQVRVVVDVLHESNKEDSSYSGSSKHLDPYHWHKWNLRYHAPSEEELVRHLEADENSEERPVHDIPVHPLVPVFDLQKHLRLRVHINNMMPYIYDRTIADKLILPDHDLRMINLLVDHAKNSFVDIVGGKGGSMNILACGRPGTGKTLTAEVFAEFKERPLYSIQCAQLGMDAAAVEKNLRIVMTRANRWNAVLLLDEADVYISKRGTDMEQNAIVGAFLRILEYAQCILFMTTNLGNNVDDAVTSRCIAKLTYDYPDPAAQVRIWHVLCNLNGITMAEAAMTDIASRHKLSGRDVKNLLKLASFAVGNSRQLVVADIDYALQFKPTE